MRLGIHMARELLDHRKVGLGQNHFDDVTVSQSAIIMVFGNSSLVPTESHSYQEWCINVHSREKFWI